jgi:hypothetical protein
MRKKPSNITEEKRTYFRLLRHMLSETVKENETYKVDRTKPLPDRMQHLLTQLENDMPKKAH